MKEHWLGSHFSEWAANSSSRRSNFFVSAKLSPCPQKRKREHPRTIHCPMLSEASIRASVAVATGIWILFLCDFSDLRKVLNVILTSQLLSTQNSSKLRRKVTLRRCINLCTRDAVPLFPLSVQSSERARLQHGNQIIFFKPTMNPDRGRWMTTTR